MDIMSEIVLYATLSVIVLAVLYSVLGRQVGRGPDEGSGPEDFLGTTRDMDEPKPNLRAAPAAAAAASNVVSMDGKAPTADLPGDLGAILALDPSMRPSTFVDQATTAYSMVLEAFAEGDRDTLGLLLTERMAGIYGEAIDDRERQELVQETDIVRIASAEIVDARLAGRAAEIDVRFTSELSSALIDSVGQPVMGDPNLIAKVNEVWTFGRAMGTDAVDWRLSDVAPEQGDAMPVDPAPDTNL